MHGKGRVGDRLAITAPSNNFPLEESAAHSVFIAGGIGVTPIWSMIQRQVELAGSWEVHYACRAAEYAAFLEDITAADGDAVGKDQLPLDRSEEPTSELQPLKRISYAVICLTQENNQTTTQLTL